MIKICYVPKRFNAASWEIIEQANQILDEYSAQGFALTLRQLYYQFVSRGLIANRQQEYKRLGSIINDARLSGDIDWEAIEDRTRKLDSLSHWESPQQIIDACAQQFQIDRWKDQDYRIEVWIEKEALSGIIEPICRKWDIPFLACKEGLCVAIRSLAGIREIRGM